MSTLFRMPSWRAAAGWLTATALLVVPPLAAQQGSERLAEMSEVIISAAGAEDVGDFNVSEARRHAGFQLFGAADAAGIGAHLSGNFAFATDNLSLCDAPLTGFCEWEVFPARGGGAFVSFQFFEVLLFAGAPPSEWIKLRNLAPSVANAKGGGYVTHVNFALFAGRLEWGPRDGTLGSLFTGVTSTDDGSCRDNTGASNGFFPTGLPLLPASNCPETWGNGVWQGDRTTPVEGWLQLLQQQGQNFAFDFWRVPDDLKRPGLFMGTGFSSFGETSDHYSEILQSYGSVIPGGTGDPAFEGWPLGLIWRFEMFSFGVPSLASVNFWRATVINRSEDVYGVGLDYDSLYLGFAPGTGGSGGGGGQRFSNYYLPEISAAIYHQSLVTEGGPCTEGARAPTGVTGCATGASRAGYNNGGNAIIVLKSPIGDLRNKLFSNPASPFFNPAHPLVGDTITFNHGHVCGFGGCWANTHNVNDRRSFGMISSTEDNSLDGRDGPGLSGSSTGWRTWRAHGYPAEVAFFNKYVPGVEGPAAATWDWNKDGQPDTLYYDTCWRDGCVTLDGDTMPGGQINAYGNVGGVLAAGPFALAAGDSTSWFVALVGDADSVRTWASIDAAIDLYMNFFLAPEAPPVAEIASLQVTAATTSGAANQNPRVTLFFTEAPEQWTDPFLAKLANDIKTAAPGTPNAVLRELNTGGITIIEIDTTGGVIDTTLTFVPGLDLVTALEQRASDNFEQLEIYKSCDGGNTFTGDGDCIGDPAVDEEGNAVGFGWEAYAILNVDANNGNIPNAFTDNAVDGGRTYLYTMVAKSRGAKFLVLTPDGLEEVLFAPVIRNTLSRSTSDVNVASVYIPASRQSGFKPASVSFTESGQEATVPFSISFSDEVTPGTYRVIFGNRFLVQRDSLISSDAVVQTRVIVQHVVNAAPAGAETTIRTNTLVRPGDEVLPVAGSAASTTVDTIGTDTVRTTDTYDGLSFTVASGTVPLFSSQDLTGPSATPTSAFALKDFPGFTISADNSDALDFNSSAQVTPPISGAETQLRGPATIARLGLSSDDTLVTRNTVNTLMVQWRETNSSRGGSNPDGAQYEVTWSGDPFGLPNGILANFANPAASGAELQAALAARTATTTGLTDQATADLVGVPQTDLVSVAAPFAVRNLTFDRPVSIAMERRLSDTYKLGSLLDTIRVEIQPDQWVPGDVLFFIEDVGFDSLDGGNVVLDGSGQPIRVTRTTVTFSEAVLGCNQPSPPACNPIAPEGRGGSGYLPMADGDRTLFAYYNGFSPSTLYDFDMVGPVTADDIAAVTDSALAEIRVVPNPFIIFSEYQSNVTDSRILFTNVPPTGTLRIYTISGQFVQQITWTPSDLSGAGDLFYDLKSRENIDIASGLYIWVLTAPSNPTNALSAPVTARGKFVVIRGRTR